MKNKVVLKVATLLLGAICMFWMSGTEAKAAGRTREEMKEYMVSEMCSFRELCMDLLMRMKSLFVI